MKIEYKKKRLNHSLIFGVIWLTISLLGIFFNDKPNWADYGFLIISFLYLGGYFYEKKNQYLTIENGTISVNQPFGKKLNLSEIKRIKKFAGDYILKTAHSELTIHTGKISETSLTDLNTELEKLNLE